MVALMSKRGSKFERRPRDFYPTPAAAVLPVLPHLPERGSFIEPCAGDGALVDVLAGAGLRCAHASDIDPQRDDIAQGDALDRPFLPIADCIITNPPWDRGILHPMIDAFRTVLPTWLLFDADWIHTLKARPFLPYCAKIVSVGRVKWIPGSKHTSFDNAAWYFFQAKPVQQTVFVGRA